MSLFDNQPEPRPDHRKKTPVVHKRKSGKNEEALVDARYGTGSRSYNASGAAQRTKQARNEITQAYERGEIQFFPDDPRWLELCYCANGGSNISPGIFGHPWHREETATFELQHHGRRKH